MVRTTIAATCDGGSHTPPRRLERTTTAGRHRDARDEIDRALAGDTAASHFHHAAYSIAEAYALVGDRDRALEFLQRTASSGMPCYPLFRDDPHLRSLATDPRFVQFMTTLRQQYEHLAATID